MTKKDYLNTLYLTLLNTELIKFEDNQEHVDFANEITDEFENNLGIMSHMKYKGKLDWKELGVEE